MGHHKKIILPLLPFGGQYHEKERVCACKRTSARRSRAAFLGGTKGGKKKFLGFANQYGFLISGPVIVGFLIHGFLSATSYCTKLLLLWFSCTQSFRVTPLRRSRKRSRSTSCWQKPSSQKVSLFTLVMWQLQVVLVPVLVLRLSLVPDEGLALGLRLLTNAGGKLTATNLAVVTPHLSLSSKGSWSLYSASSTVKAMNLVQSCVNSASLLV